MNSENLKSVPAPLDKVPSKKVNEKYAVPSTGMRNPLRDLCENISHSSKPPENIKIHKIASRIVTVRRSEVKKVRSKSSSTVESKVKYYFESENITERRYHEEIVDNKDEVFVAGEKHYLNYLPENKDVEHISKPKAEVEIEQPLPVIRITRPSSESLETRKPAKKVTLVRKLSHRRKRCCTEEEFYKDCLYDADYFEENYNYMLEREKYFVFRKDLLNKVFDVNYRMIVVNWLIYVQQVIGLTPPTFFVGIRMFDCMLLSSRVPSNMYTLVGVTCFWIANKNLDVHFVQVPKLFSLCNGKYSRQQILSTEKQILKALKFNTNFAEPTCFLFYYLHREKLENDLKIRYSAMFLLEMCTLLLDFSSLRPSVLASISLFLVLTKYNLESGAFLKYIDGCLLDRDIFLRKSTQLENCLKQLLICKAVTEEVVEKYSTAEKCFVAKSFVST